MAGPRLTKVVPAIIVGVAAGFLAYFGLSYFLPELRSLDHNKLAIGTLFSDNASMTAALRERWTALGAVRFSDLANLLMPAVTLSVLLSIDTLKTCVVMDTITRSRHNSNRELIGQGVANFVCVHGVECTKSERDASKKCRIFPVTVSRMAWISIQAPNRG